MVFTLEIKNENGLENISSMYSVYIQYIQLKNILLSVLFYSENYY